MDFSKPKVTIDLDEYNYLKEQKESPVSFTEFDITANTLKYYYNKLARIAHKELLDKPSLSSTNLVDHILDTIIKTIETMNKEK